MTESKSSNRKINYKSDFSFILDLKHLDTKNSEQDVGFPNYDFTILLYTNKFKKYVVKYTKNPETFVNCANFDGNLQIILNNHRLEQGVLYAEVYLELPNKSFPDGKQLQVCPIKLDIELVDECTEELEDDDVIFIAPYIKGDKGDKGDPLTWESMSEYDKEDLVGKVKVVVEEDAPFVKGEGANSATLKGSDTTKAQGSYAVAIGLGSNAEGKSSFAEGDSVASGSHSHAEGCSVTIDGTKNYTKAVGDYSHAEGQGSEARGTGSHAEGYMTIAAGVNSHAEGSKTQAARQYSHSEGTETIASGNASHAEGRGTRTYSTGEHAEGKYNISSADGTTIHSVGIGKSDSDRQNAHEITVDGKHYIPNIGGYNGKNSKEAQDVATVINNKLDSNDTPFKFNVAKNGAVLKGSNSTAGNLATALGEQTYASGIGSLTEGLTTYAMGHYSHAEGYGEEMSDDDHIKLELGYVSVDSVWEHTKINIAKGDYSHVEGQQNIASGKGSHAEGFGSQSYSEGSHAEGKNTAAKGPYSHSEGERTITSNSGEHAEGVYNKSNSNTLHSVGCGDASIRKNAHEITTDGKHYILDVGGYDGTNPQSSQDIVTVLNGKTDIAIFPILSPAYRGALSDTQFDEYYRAWNNKGIIIFYGGAPQITFNCHHQNNSTTIYSIGTEISNDGTVKVYRCELHKYSHEYTIQLIGTNSSAQPDWSAGFGEVGYIKNRTHFIDTSYGFKMNINRDDCVVEKGADGNYTSISFTATYLYDPNIHLCYLSGATGTLEELFLQEGEKGSLSFCNVTYIVAEDFTGHIIFDGFVDDNSTIEAELEDVYEDPDNFIITRLNDYYIPDSVKIVLKEASSINYKDVF